MRSVPDDTIERDVLIKIALAAGVGTGISSSTMRPSASDCRSCCMIPADLNIDESTTPQLEAHECKYGVATVDSSFPIVVDQRANRGWIEESTPTQNCRRERILDPAAQLMP